MKKLPCIDCICLAICRAKLMSDVVKCETIIDFLQSPTTIATADSSRGAFLSNGTYVSSDDWDMVCDYLNKSKHKINDAEFKPLIDREYGGKK